MNKFKYYFYRLVSNFCFGKLKQKFNDKKLRCKRILYPKKILVNCKGEGNIFNEEIIKTNNINLTIDGSNNEVIIDENIKNIGWINLVIYGDNNKIQLGNLSIHKLLAINIGDQNLNRSKNCIVKIGNSCDFVETWVMLLENESSLKIGEACMLSEQIHVRLSDTHSVLDMNNNLLNYGGHVEIGDCIVGASSIVTKKFKQQNSVIAGNPAKVVKSGIKWSGLSPQKYLDLHKFET